MVYSFQQQTELEQLRAAEGVQTSSFAAPVPGDQQTYEDWLQQRLSAFKAVPGQAELLQQPTVLFNRFVFGLMAVFGLIGLFSASSLISAAQQQVNVFWLLGALLGANGVTLLLWLIFVMLLRGHSAGFIATLLEWPLAKIFGAKLKPTVQQAANLAWWQTQFSPSLQTWRFSGLTHLAWLCFLSGSLLGLIWVFTTQQYDFIWQSTLVSQSRFYSLIQTLGAPLEFFFLPSAPLEQVELSPEAQRQQWALFIFACVLLYAIIPRALVLIVAQIILHFRQRRWQLDFSQDYYITLRCEYNGYQWRTQVIDADPKPPSTAQCAPGFGATEIPPNLAWYGLEVDPTRPWQSLLPGVKQLLNEAQQVTQLQAELQQMESDFVVFVEGQRLPDRGLMRYLKSFNGDKLWLAITTDKDLSQTQQNAWLKAILQCQLNAQQCVLVKTA